MRTAIGIAIALICVPIWGADWLTDGGNPQRTAWQKDEKILGADSVKGMKLLWKLKLDNQPRQMHSLFPPLIVERVNTASGPRQIAIEAGVSDNIYAIDVEKGEVVWKKHFESTWTPPATGGRGGELWSSGDQIKSWNHWSGLAIANGRVYIATFDGNLYCFGVKK